MKINITKKQYKALMKSVMLGAYILSVSNDYFGDEELEKDAKSAREIEDYLMEFAKDFGCEEIRNDENFEETADIMHEYEEFSMFDQLALNLGKRDYLKGKSKEEIQKMFEKNNGMWDRDAFKLVAEYEEEFNKNGIERIEVKKD